MRTAINITGELKYILDNEKNRVVVPFHTLRASELIKQDVELVNHDYSVALYGFRYEATTRAGTIRYLFLVEHSMAGFRPYAVYHDLPDNMKAIRDTIDFSLFHIAEPSELSDDEPKDEEDTAEDRSYSIWQRMRHKWLPRTMMNQDQRQQQRRSGKGLLIVAAVCAVVWTLAQWDSAIHS